MRGRMAVLLGLAMLPAGAIAMQVGLNAVSARQEAFREELGRRALQSLTDERQIVDQTREMLRVLASSPDLRSNAPDCRAWLSRVMQRYRNLASISVLSNDGVVRCSTPAVATGFRAPPSALRDRAATLDTFVLGFVARGQITGRPVLSAIEPLHDANGRRVGFVGASIALADLRETLDADRSRDGARSAIVDMDGRVVVESSFDPDDENTPSLPSPEQIRSMLGAEPRFIEVENGDAVIVPLHEPDLYAVMAWPSGRAPWREALDLTGSIAAPLLIWLLAIAAGWFAIEIFVARPLSTLEAAARGFARGEEVGETPAMASAPEEIRALRRTLAAMAKTLRGREQRLVETLGEERALLREVHHRVKNNLQMVASLLNIQARAAADESEARGLARAHDRVQLMALVHQRIYASGEVRSLRLDELAAEIARHLLQSRGAPAKDIDLKLELSEARVDVDRAVPATFLIGEALSNAFDALADMSANLRLAVCEDETGEIRISLEGEGGVESLTTSPSARLIDAFARQLGAAIGRDPQRPYAIWVRLPPMA